MFVVDASEGKCLVGRRRGGGGAGVWQAGRFSSINKIDDRRSQAGALEFYRLGFEPVFEVSAEHGVGIGRPAGRRRARLAQFPKLRGKAAAHPAEPEPAGGSAPLEGRRTEPDQDRLALATPASAEIRVAIVGRPNVGKSSLVNRMLREERVLVSDVPGTTRDAIDVILQWQRRQFRIVDTAGIRRPGRVARSGVVEAVSVLQAKRAIERADVVVIVLDAVEGATDQDAAIAGEADKAGAG